MTGTLDLIVIDTCMAGINAAKKAAQAGCSVAIVERTSLRRNLRPAGL